MNLKLSYMKKKHHQSVSDCTYRSNIAYKHEESDAIMLTQV